MVTKIESIPKFKEIIDKNQSLVVIHFTANFVEECLLVTNFLNDLSIKFDSDSAKFYLCEAEELSEVSLNYKIEAVPTVLYFINGKLVDRVNGSNTKQIFDTVVKHAGKPEESNKEPLNDRLKKLINHHKVMVFMKGNRTQPKCGFSKQLIGILNETGVNYDTFDILEDEEVRQGLKTYSDWPTYPQVYVKGDLIGGLDIIKELQSDNELLSVLRAE